MSTLGAVPNLTTEELRQEIKNEYIEVALDPDKGYHFHTGRAAASRLGYDEALYADLPEGSIASFAGTGNPFMLGPINQGETVVDAGSGSGFDALIAATMVGPEGQVRRNSGGKKRRKSDQTAAAGNGVHKSRRKSGNTQKNHCLCGDWFQRYACCLPDCPL